MKKSTKDIKSRPIGIWCLGVDGALTAPKSWCQDVKPQGCLVVTEDTAFIITPYVNAALQWGAMDQVKSSLINDIDSFDSKAATDAMLSAYKEMYYEDKDGKIWDVYGSPAAEWCRKHKYGDIPAGMWDLPTVAQLKIMHKNVDAINECLTTIGGYKLTPGAYWSSIGYSPEFAWFVLMNHGYTDYGSKYGTNIVRAVSAFQI